MRSSSGAYYIGLDHLRALAAFLVFTWHFLHSAGLPYGSPPSFFPLAILDEGHTGVALFMTLSGYLFAKLLDRKEIHYGWFLWNRLLRLGPLLLLGILLKGAIEFNENGELLPYLTRIVRGIIFPTLPNGGWSITTEAHFYILLPFILSLMNRNIVYGIAILIGAIVLRNVVLYFEGEVQWFAYHTIGGRIDQFLLGMVFFRIRDKVKGKHTLAFVLLLIFMVSYYLFDWFGGFYKSYSFPSPYPTWIILPTVEGSFYGFIIAYYDSSFNFRDTGLSAILSRIGACSYSIYILHFFVVFKMGWIINAHMRFHDNFYACACISLLMFVLFVPIASFSYYYFEMPFMRFRHSYIRVNMVSPIAS